MEIDDIGENKIDGEGIFDEPFSNHPAQMSVIGISPSGVWEMCRRVPISNGTPTRQGTRETERWDSNKPWDIDLQADPLNSDSKDLMGFR